LLPFALSPKRIRGCSRNDLNRQQTPLIPGSAYRKSFCGSDIQLQPHYQFSPAELLRLIFLTVSYCLFYIHFLEFLQHSRADSSATWQFRSSQRESNQHNMSNFITNLFPSSAASKNENAVSIAPPPLQTRSSQTEGFERPNTPTRNNFITPVSTPHGSPSKRQQPPGAHDLPTAFENAMKIAPPVFGSPTKSNRGTPLSPGKNNALAVDDSYFANSSGNVDDSIIHKSATPGSPLRKQGKENTPPSSRQGIESSQNQAALSRQELYQSRDLQPQTSRKYNTQRGLTAEELEILNKPNVKRLANVTQLCKDYLFFVIYLLISRRFPRLLLRPSQLCWCTTKSSLPLQIRIPRPS
jgi:hypothetical protein